MYKQTKHVQKAAQPWFLTAVRCYSSGGRTAEEESEGSRIWDTGSRNPFPPYAAKNLPGVKGLQVLMVQSMGSGSVLKHELQVFQPEMCSKVKNEVRLGKRKFDSC